MKEKVKLNIGVWFVLLAILFFGLGWQAGQSGWNLNSLRFWGLPELVSSSSGIKNTNPPSKIADSADFSLFWDVWQKVSDQYMDKSKVDPQKMMLGAISGMVSAIGDPYTTFLPPEQNQAIKEELGGSFEGVGIQLGFSDHQIVVIAPLKDTPAQRAGVRAGDALIKIGDKETINMALPEAVSLIRGKKGTMVQLTLARPSQEKPFVVSLTRDVIIIKSVELEMKNRIAYLKLIRFGDSTNQEWNKAVGDLVAKGATGVVLDVRNDPGGYLSSAVYILGEFFDSGVAVKTETVSGAQESLFINRSSGRLMKIPVVVLINKGSASASEIVAGAIQDRNLGKLVGEQSFGKGTIQESIELPQKTGLHITTSKWLLPSGKWINGTGLTPDYKIELTEDDIKNNRDPQLEKALTLF